MLRVKWMGFSLDLRLLWVIQLNLRLFVGNSTRSEISRQILLNLRSQLTQTQVAFSCVFVLVIQFFVLLLLFVT